jgi:hypothetical protein
MIHAYLFMTKNNKDSSDHGSIFQSWMNKINQEENTKITIFHTFHDEVDYYRVHWWECEKCLLVIKRAMNRAPSRHDNWWAEHVMKCGGNFKKTKEPEKKEKKEKKEKNSIMKYLEKKCSNCKKELKSKEEHVCETKNSSEIISLDDDEKDSFETLHFKRDYNQVDNFLRSVDSETSGILYPPKSKDSISNPLKKKFKESSSLLDDENPIVFTPFKLRSTSALSLTQSTPSRSQKASDYYISPSPKKSDPKKSLSFTQPSSVATSKNLDDSKDLFDSNIETPESQREFLNNRLKNSAQKAPTIDLTVEESQTFRGETPS